MRVLSSSGARCLAPNLYWTAGATLTWADADPTRPLRPCGRAMGALYDCERSLALKDYGRDRTLKGSDEAAGRPGKAERSVARQTF